jgi:hypothetical protein
LLITTHLRGRQQQQQRRQRQRQEEEEEAEEKECERLERKAEAGCVIQDMAR